MVKTEFERSNRGVTGRYWYISKDRRVIASTYFDGISPKYEGDGWFCIIVFVMGDLLGKNHHADNEVQDGAP